MDLLFQTIAWLTDPAHYAGPDGIPTRVWEHLTITVVSLTFAAAVALPAGIFVGHTRRGTTLVVNLANIGRALPALAVLVIVLPFVIRPLGLGFWPTLIAMVLLAIPPIVTNSYVGISEVDPEIVEAARGMGLRERDIALRVELPLAMPVVIAGLRNAAVAVVATATLGALVAGGGLGRYIVDGNALQEYPRLAAGAFLVAALAVFIEQAFGLLERRVTSPGISRTGNYDRGRSTSGLDPRTPVTPGGGGVSI